MTATMHSVPHSASGSKPAGYAFPGGHGLPESCTSRLQKVPVKALAIFSVSCTLPAWHLITHHNASGDV